MGLPFVFGPQDGPIATNELDADFNYVLAQISAGGGVVTVNPAKYCALDGVTDDTAGLQTALQVAGAGKSVVVEFPYGVTCYIAGTVYFATDTEINFNGSILLGPGNTTMLASGYWSGGVIVSNAASGLVPNQLVNVRIHDGVIVGNSSVTGSLALAMYNCNDQCIFENLRVIFCTQALFSKDCFYSIYRNITFRSPPSLAQASQTVPAFWWTASGGSGFNNGLVERCSVGGGSATPSDPSNPKWAFWLDGDCQHSTWLNCSAEECLIGVQAKGELQGYQWIGTYFENVDTAFDLSVAHPQHSVFIDWSWMLNVTTAVTAAQWTNGVWGQNNQINGAAITINTLFSDKPTVVLPTNIVSSPARAVLPTGVTLANDVVVDYVRGINGGSGTTSNKAHIRGATIPFFFSGGVGAPVVNTVPFTTISGAGTATITIDTDMLFTSFDMFGYFFQVVGTSVGTKNCAGFVMGATVCPQTAGSLYNGFTISALSNAGYLQITIHTTTGGETLTSVYGLLRHL